MVGAYVRRRRLPHLGLLRALLLPLSLVPWRWHRAHILLLVFLGWQRGRDVLGCRSLQTHGKAMRSSSARRSKHICIMRAEAGPEAQTTRAAVPWLPRWGASACASPRRFAGEINALARRLIKQGARDMLATSLRGAGPTSGSSCGGAGPTSGPSLIRPRPETTQ